MSDSNIKVPIMSELAAQGKQPEVLFWVGCAGSFDQRAQKVTIAFVPLGFILTVPVHTAAAVPYEYYH